MTMRTKSVAVTLAALAVSVLAARSANAAQPGCVDVLSDCISSSSVWTTICGPGPHPLSGGDSSQASFIVFGPGVKSVILTACGGSTAAIAGDSDLCSIPGGFNDNLCAVEIVTGSPAPAMNRLGLFVLVLSLAGLGLRRRAGKSTT